MTQSTTFYWYDYETFGLDTLRDRPAQFAGMRTTLQFEPVAEADGFLLPSFDGVPARSDGLRAHGITPQTAAEKGMPEVDFAKRVFKELNTPATISVGYNSIGFDDKVNRALFWRSLLDVYSHVWRNGCSRWDLYPFVLAVWRFAPRAWNGPRCAAVIQTSPNVKPSNLKN